MAQLTMGDYQRILENPDCWDKLGWTLDAGRWTLDAGRWTLDRWLFSARPREISQVRNNLMHFNNDPLPDDMVSMLQNFLDLLHEYGK
jgi:hypothetical protein